MSDDLYFVPIIAQALEERDPEESLKQALDRIISLGSQPRYKRGFEQFERFMDTVKGHLEPSKTDLLEDSSTRALMINLVTETFEGSNEKKQTALRIIQSRPQWQREYDEFGAEIVRLSRRPQGIGISIFRENELFRSVTLTEISATKTVEGLTPGGYQVNLSTGRLIWEGELTERDLIWTRAFPGRPLELAADTVGWKGRSTKQIVALDGEITIQVFAGLESGRIEITLNASGDL